MPGWSTTTTNKFIRPKNVLDANFTSPSWAPRRPSLLRGQANSRSATQTIRIASGKCRGFFFLTRKFQMTSCVDLSTQNETAFFGNLFDQKNGSMQTFNYCVVVVCAEKLLDCYTQTAMFISQKRNRTEQPGKSRKRHARSGPENSFEKKKLLARHRRLECERKWSLAHILLFVYWRRTILTAMAHTHTFCARLASIK